MPAKPSYGLVYLAVLPALTTSLSSHIATYPGMSSRPAWEIEIMWPFIAILAILATLGIASLGNAFGRGQGGQRLISMCSVVAPALIEIGIAQRLIASSVGTNWIGIFVLALLAIPCGMMANVQVNARWRTQSLWWATVRGMVVAALTAAVLIGALILVGMWNSISHY